MFLFLTISPSPFGKTLMRSNLLPATLRIRNITAPTSLSKSPSSPKPSNLSSIGSNPRFSTSRYHKISTGIPNTNTFNPHTTHPSTTAGMTSSSTPASQSQFSISTSPISNRNTDASQSQSLTTELGIENTSIDTAPGISLTPHQKVLVGSTLDLFAGKPSLKKLQLWKDDATFADPLTKAVGRKKFEAQWYGLVAAFSEIERLSHQVTSAGNPITMDLKTRYKVKGIGTEQVIKSKVQIFTEGADGEERITEVQDRWNNEISEGPFAKAFRNLNAVAVPAFVSVPKNEEEDAKKSL